MKRLFKSLFTFMFSMSMLSSCAWEKSESSSSNQQEFDNISVLVPKAASEGDSDQSDKKEQFSVETIDLGANGDSSLIHYGNKQILIDAGGTKKSGENIIKNLNDYCKDGVIDYVIFSHGDRDHIVNFSKETSDYSIEKWLNDDDNRKIDFLIDFDVWDDKSLTYSSNYYTDKRKSQDAKEEDNVDERKTTYEKYVSAKKRLIESKKINHYFTASEVLYSKRDNITIKDLMSKNGKKDYSSLPEDGTFVLDASNNFTLKILDNPYCYNPIDWTSDHIPSSVDRNILSVCSLITFGKEKYKYLFTGDLPEFQGTDYSREHAGGETALVKHNYDDLKENVIFYKAAHHGSATSNTDVLLSLIRPQYVSVSCVIDGQYNFPSQDVLNRIGLYTDKIFFTDVKDEDSVSPFSGQISFVYDEENDLDQLLKVSCSGSRKEISILDTSLISSSASIKRDFPVTVSELTNKENKSISINYTSYFKLGSTDVLIDDGGDSFSDMDVINKQIDALCNDHVLDCLIISSQLSWCYQFLDFNIGLFSNRYHIKKVKNVIVHPHTNGDSYDMKLLSLIGEGMEKGYFENVYGVSKKKNSGNVTTNDYSKYYQFDQDSIFQKKNSFDLSLGNVGVHILSSEYNTMRGDAGKNYFQNSLPVVISALDFDYLNLGVCYDPEINKKVLDDAVQFKGKIDAMTIPGFGYYRNQDHEVSYTSTVTRYYKDIISKTNSAFLFNCPFGCTSQGLNLYPSMYWKYNEDFQKCKSQIDSKEDSTGVFMASTKAVKSKQRSVIDETKTNGSLALVSYLCSKRMRIWKYRENDSSYPSLSIYDESLKKRSDYTKANARTVKDDSLKNLL